MDLPKHIKPHSPDHQRQVCRFLRIPLSEYDNWLRMKNYVIFKRWNQCQMDARDEQEKNKRSNYDEQGEKD